jgi:hypothetical protein
VLYDKSAGYRVRLHERWRWKCWQGPFVCVSAAPRRTSLRHDLKGYRTLQHYQNCKIKQSWYPGVEFWVWTLPRFLNCMVLDPREAFARTVSLLNKFCISTASVRWAEEIAGFQTFRKSPCRSQRKICANCSQICSPAELAKWQSCWESAWAGHWTCHNWHPISAGYYTQDHQNAQYFLFLQSCP